MNAKIAKLEEQFAEDALRNPYKESSLFAGISIFVNGLTNPSADELKRIMMVNGGVYHIYQRPWTTFVIAANLPDVKVRQITTAKIITPQWVVDCLSENRILDYSKYLLYTNCKESQPRLAFGPKEASKREIATAVVQTTAGIVGDAKPAGLVSEPDEAERAKVAVEPSATENGTEAADPAKPANFVNNLDFLNTLIRDNETPTKPEEKPRHLPTENDTPKTNVARTAVDPNFLAEFYNNSRLHHIATLGASFKQHITKLRDSHTGTFLARDVLKQTLPQRADENGVRATDGNVIMHIDMDCFFVSVGLRTRPHLKGFPIAVTHSKGAAANNVKHIDEENRKQEMALYVRKHEDRLKKIQTKFGADPTDDKSNDSTMAFIEGSASLSEIASCSYEARRSGIKNGMFVGAALKLCPNLKTIPYDFDAYKEVAHILYATIAQWVKMENRNHLQRIITSSSGSMCLHRYFAQVHAGH